MSLMQRMRLQIENRVKTELSKHYYGNSVDYRVNVEGARRIKDAQRHARHQSFDSKLRKEYDRNWCSRLEGRTLEPALFESVRARTVAALDDPELSPCCFNRGNQADRQGIPRAAIKRDYRRYTTDVRAVIPDALQLLDASVVDAIRSCIGSNFVIDNISLTRNFHLEPELGEKYDILSDRWHFDHQYPDRFFLFINLGDYTEAEGPTQWINRPDSVRMLRKGYNADLRISSRSGGLPDGTIEQCPSYSRLTGRAGSMLLMHASYCLHRSGVPAPGRIRDVLFFICRPAKEMRLEWPAP